MTEPLVAYELAIFGAGGRTQRLVFTTGDEAANVAGAMEASGLTVSLTAVVVGDSDELAGLLEERNDRENELNALIERLELQLSSHGLRLRAVEREARRSTLQIKAMVAKGAALLDLEDIAAIDKALDEALPEPAPQPPASPQSVPQRRGLRPVHRTSSRDPGKLGGNDEGKA
jgi:hypothetical protein